MTDQPPHCPTCCCQPPAPRRTFIVESAQRASGFAFLCDHRLREITDDDTVRCATCLTPLGEADAEAHRLAEQHQQRRNMRAVP